MYARVYVVQHNYGPSSSTLVPEIFLSFTSETEVIDRCLHDEEMNTGSIQLSFGRGDNFLTKELRIPEFQNPVIPRPSAKGERPLQNLRLFTVLYFFSYFSAIIERKKANARELAWTPAQSRRCRRKEW